jgi:hypothetical protein
VIFLLQILAAVTVVLVAVLTPADRRMNGRKGAHKSWAHTPDRALRTARARAAADKRFEDEVDPDRVLPAEERARRADSARRAWYAELARRSAAARRRGGPDDAAA